MGLIRPLRLEDIPEVVALRSRAFHHSRWQTGSELQAYVERIFFHNPWRQDDLPSLIYLDAAGRVAGFLGVVPRPATLCGEPVRLAVSTQLMVDPASRGLGGVQLVKAFLSGPQDLSFADLANDVSRRLWEGLGGFVSIVHSLYWTQPLRPSRFNAAKSAHGLVARSLATGWRPVSWALDRLSASWHPVDGLQGTPLTATVMATHADEVFDCIGLRAEYDERSTDWLLRQVAAKRDLGELRGVALRDDQGTVVGWHLYYANAGGVGQVVQVAARKERYGDVLDSLFYDAWQRGLTALSGRLESPLLAALGERRTGYDRQGPWALVHSPRADVLAAMQRGDAHLSRLDGEWWMSF